MASICLKHLEDWGWLRRDYDEVLDSYVVSFPEYSQMFVELFVRLHSEEHTRERESVLAVYSYLYTYCADKEKNKERPAGFALPVTDACQYAGGYAGIF